MQSRRQEEMLITSLEFFLVTTQVISMNLITCLGEIFNMHSVADFHVSAVYLHFSV